MKVIVNTSTFKENDNERITSVINDLVKTIKQNNEEIDFNGIPFTFSIGVVFETKMSYENSMKTNDEEINYLNNL